MGNWGGFPVGTPQVPVPLQGPLEGLKRKIHLSLGIEGMADASQALGRLSGFSQFLFQLPRPFIGLDGFLEFRFTEKRVTETPPLVGCSCTVSNGFAQIQGLSMVLGRLFKISPGIEGMPQVGPL